MEYPFEEHDKEKKREKDREKKNIRPIGFHYWKWNATNNTYFRIYNFYFVFDCSSQQKSVHETSVEKNVNRIRETSQMRDNWSIWMKQSLRDERGQESHLRSNKKVERLIIKNNQFKHTKRNEKKTHSESCIKIYGYTYGHVHFRKMVCFLLPMILRQHLPPLPLRVHRWPHRIAVEPLWLAVFSVV